MFLQLLQEAITKIFPWWLFPRDFDITSFNIWFHEKKKKRMRPIEICFKPIYVIWFNTAFYNIMSLLSFLVWLLPDMPGSEESTEYIWYISYLDSFIIFFKSSGKCSTEISCLREQCVSMENTKHRREVGF